MRIVRSTGSLILLAIFFFSQSVCIANVEVYFSPRGQAEETVVREIDSARRSIDVAMYSFSDHELAKALIQAKNRGVKLRIILDRSQSREKSSQVIFLNSEGSQPRLLSGVGKGIMHDKFAVIDGKILITGSFNWTSNAENNNHENLVVITYETKVIAAFQDEFNKLFNEAKNQAKLHQPARHLSVSKF